MRIKIWMIVMMMIHYRLETNMNQLRKNRSINQFQHVEMHFVSVQCHAIGLFCIIFHCIE